MLWHRSAADETGHTRPGKKLTQRVRGSALIRTETCKRPKQMFLNQRSIHLGDDYKDKKDPSEPIRGAEFVSSNLTLHTTLNPSARTSTRTGPKESKETRHSYVDT